MADIAKIAGQLWKEVDDEAKAKWNEKAKEDKERYEPRYGTTIRGRP